jgi:hypothetical protein
MSEFLRNLAARNLGPGPSEVVQPRIPSLYEPRRRDSGLSAPRPSARPREATPGSRHEPGFERAGEATESVRDPRPTDRFEKPDLEEAARPSSLAPEGAPTDPLAVPRLYRTPAAAPDAHVPSLSPSSAPEQLVHSAERQPEETGSLARIPNRAVPGVPEPPPTPRRHTAAPTAKPRTVGPAEPVAEARSTHGFEQPHPRRVEQLSVPPLDGETGSVARMPNHMAPSVPEPPPTPRRHAAARAATPRAAEPAGLMAKAQQRHEIEQPQPRRAEQVSAPPHDAARPNRPIAPWIARSLAPALEATASAVAPPADRYPVMPLARARPGGTGSTVAPPEATSLVEPRSVSPVREVEPESEHPFAPSRPAAEAAVRGANAAEAPIRVTIGRVEVRAIFPQPPAPRAPETGQRATLSLDDYLGNHRQGKR